MLQTTSSDHHLMSRNQQSAARLRVLRTSTALLVQYEYHTVRDAAGVYQPTGDALLIVPSCLDQAQPGSTAANFTYSTHTYRSLARGPWVADRYLEFSGLQIPLIGRNVWTSALDYHIRDARRYSSCIMGSFIKNDGVLNSHA